MNRIFFWNWHLGADKIIARFDSGQMSNAEKLRHLLVISVLVTVLGGFAYDFDSPDYLTTMAPYIVIDLLSLILGMLYLYHKHTETSSFIEKYFVVLVATIPVVVVCIGLPIYMLATEGYHLLFGIEAEANIWYEVAITAIINIATYLKIGTYFR